MLGHGGDKVFDQLVRDQRMPQVEFGDVGLSYLLVGDSGPTVRAGSKEHMLAER